MLTTILVHAGVAAVGAAIAWALSGVIFADREPEERPKWPIAAGIALAVVLGRPIAAWIDKPTTASVMREMERQQPVFALLREREPVAYERLRGVVGAMIQSGRADPDEAARQGREIMSEVMLRRTMIADDPVIDEQIDIIVAQTQALQPQPRICADLLAGRAGDVRRHLPQPLQQREIDLYTRLLGSDAAAAPVMMPFAEAEVEMQRIMPTVAEEVGISMEELMLAMQGQGDPARACHTGRSFLEHIKRLEAPRRAALYRRLMSEAQTTAPPPTGQ